MAFIPQTYQEIQNNIIAAKQSQTALNGLTSTSKVAYWNLWAFIFSVGAALQQQLWAILQAEIEADVASSVPGTALWIQSEILKFQDGSIVQINGDFTVSYPVIIPSAQVITAAAVVVTNGGAILAKVAGGSPLAPISGGQQTELSAYLNSILPAGQNVSVISALADTLQVSAIIYYNGQYNNVIQANVILALQNYMMLVPFNGLVKISDIEKAILSVAGVVDVVFSTILCTPVLGSPVYLVQSSATLNRSYQSYSGYLTNSNSPNDFASTLTFSVAQQ